MGVFGSLVGFGQAAQQQGASAHAYKRRYQWQRQDLEKAGYNPMLPFLGKGPGAPAAASMAKADTPDMGINKTVTNVLAAKRQATELSEIRSREQLNKYLGNKATADASHSASQKTLTDVQTLMQLFDMPRAMNASSLEKEYGPNKQKAEWIFQRLGEIIPGLIFGVGRYGPQRGARGAGKPAPGAGRIPNKSRAPYVGPRRDYDLPNSKRYKDRKMITPRKGVNR